MPTNYPGALDTINQTNPTPTSPRNSPSLSSKITDLSDALVAIETELGTDPSGTETTVKDRLAALNTAVNQTEGVATFGREGTLLVSSGKGRFVFPWAATVLGVRATVNTAPTGAALIVDVNKAEAATPGSLVTIFTTQANRPTIAASAFASGEAVPDVTAFAAGDHMTVDIDQVGSTVAGADLTVVVRYRRA